MITRIIMFISIWIGIYIFFRVLFNKSANEAQHQQMQVIESFIPARIAIFILSPIFLIIFLALKLTTFFKIHIFN